MVHQILHIIFFILFIYLSVITLYFFVVAVAGKFYKGREYSVSPGRKKIAVLIPTYKEDHIIVNTARKAKEHDYPADSFQVFVAADKLKKETIDQLRAIPVNVLEVQFELSSKARSLNKLLNWIPGNEFDIAIILDADNIMLLGCLEKVNAAFQAGFNAVQTHRKAKNRNTSVAVLDAMSEEINNHIFRKGQRALGFSANTIGSGMAFQFNKLKDIYNKPGILGNPACDREVDFEIMKGNICIEYVEDAYVLDEKVSSQEVFEKQRTRWFESQILHLRLFFDKKQQPIPKTKDYWNKLFNNLVPPRLLLLLSFFFVFLVFVVEYFSNYSILYPSYLWWFVITAAYFLIFIISLPTSFYSWQTLRAIAHIPLLLISVVRAVFKMKVNRKEFLHTEKAFTE
jgi:cellulose synthase/poly-beta-1,6-N-acetylglucosamine synthase-like glycosyltransferase